MDRVNRMSRVFLESKTTLHLPSSRIANYGTIHNTYGSTSISASAYNIDFIDVP